MCCVRDDLRWGILGANVAVKAFQIAYTAANASKMVFADEVSPLSLHYISAHSCSTTIHMSMHETTVGTRCCEVIIEK